MARKGGYGSIQPTRLETSANDSEMHYLVPLDESEVGKAVDLTAAAHN